MYITKRTRKKIIATLDLTAIILVLFGAIHLGITETLNYNVLWQLSQITFKQLATIFYWAIPISAIYLLGRLIKKIKN